MAPERTIAVARIVTTTRGTPTGTATMMSAGPETATVSRPRPDPDEPSMVKGLRTSVPERVRTSDVTANGGVKPPGPERPMYAAIPRASCTATVAPSSPSPFVSTARTRIVHRTSTREFASSTRLCTVVSMRITLEFTGASRAIREFEIRIVAPWASFPRITAPSRLTSVIDSPDATRMSLPSIRGAPPSPTMPPVEPVTALLVIFAFERWNRTPRRTPTNAFDRISAEELRRRTPSDPPEIVLFVTRRLDVFSTFTPTVLFERTFPSNAIGGRSVVGSWKYAIALSWRLFQLKQFRRRALYPFAP